MQSHSDQDLVILVSLGGWIRGTQVVSSSILQNYDQQAAKVLRQPALVSFMQSKINAISPDLRDNALIKNVSEQLTEMEKLVSFPAGQAPSIDDVRKVNTAASNMMTAIRSKTEKK